MTSNEAEHGKSLSRLSRVGEDDPDHEAGWPQAEIQPTVTLYFSMLRAELAGQPYIKARFNREAQAATGRSRGAVEFKFANISAVLRDIGMPYVRGYQPRGNYQKALLSEVEHVLAHDPEMPQLLESTPLPPLSPAVQLLKVEPPIAKPRSTVGQSHPVAGIDYLQRQERNQSIGVQGEQLVGDYERAWLSTNGRPDLADRVSHIPTTLGDGAGYDIGSFTLAGSAHHIEVKTTSGGIMVPFFLSASELRHAKEYPGLYSIYRVFDLGLTPSFYAITGPVEEVLDLTPVSYQARIRPQGS